MWGYAALMVGAAALALLYILSDRDPRAAWGPIVAVLVLIGASVVAGVLGFGAAQRDRERLEAMIDAQALERQELEAQIAALKMCDSEKLVLQGDMKACLVGVDALKTHHTQILAQMEKVHQADLAAANDRCDVRVVKASIECEAGVITVELTRARIEELSMKLTQAEQRRAEAEASLAGARQSLVEAQNRLAMLQASYDTINPAYEASVRDIANERRRRIDVEWDLFVATSQDKVCDHYTVAERRRACEERTALVLQENQARWIACERSIDARAVDVLQFPEGPAEAGPGWVRLDQHEGRVWYFAPCDPALPEAAGGLQ